jgi:hypothetical protein
MRFEGKHDNPATETYISWRRRLWATVFIFDLK